MKRREFLKRCGLVPFIGSLATVGQAGESESKAKDKSFAEEKAQYCGGQNGRLCPRCKFNDNVKTRSGALPIGPLGQMRKALMEQNFPKEYII